MRLKCLYGPCDGGYAVFNNQNLEHGAQFCYLGMYHAHIYAFDIYRGHLVMVGIRRIHHSDKGFTFDTGL